MILLFTSLFASLVICGLLVRYQDWHLRFTGDHNQAGSQKFHGKVTPRIGGLGILAGLITAVIINSFINPPLANSLAQMTLAALPVFTVGTAEDLTKRIGIKVRLVTAFFSGMLFLSFFDVTAIRLEIPIVDTLASYPAVAVLFLAFAISGLSNAYNIIDGLNGLSSMVGIIAAVGILFVAFKVRDPLVMSLALITIGSIVGFFLLNYPRGLIFLGDGGAYLIGFLIAIASILLVVRHPSVSPWFALIINVYPIFETLYSIWRRVLYQRRNPGLPDVLHFHSLIYRFNLRSAHDDGQPNQHILLNAKTSPYLWALSSLGVIPAILWWDSTFLLMISGVVFVVHYLYAYRTMATFLKAPTDICSSPIHRDR